MGFHVLQKPDNLQQDTLGQLNHIKYLSIEFDIVH